MRRSMFARLAPVAAAALLIAATSGAVASAHGRTVKPQATGANIGWTMISQNLMGWRYSAASQINTTNVGQLKKAWEFNAGKIPGGIEDTPLVIGNVAYVTTAFNHVFALNATTGAELWSYNPNDGLEVACCGPDARGLAYHAGTLYQLTLDDRLIALNAQTGAVKWQVKVGSAKQGVAETASPLFYNGNIYIGSSGAEFGIRGFEEARSAATGKLEWIFYTVPPRSQSWVKLNHGIAGGTVWNNPVINPQTGLLYIDTANPAPLLYANNRPGPDHWTDSVVALNAMTGKFEWAQQTVPHDMWDYDNSANPILVPTGDGMGIGVPGKSGMYWEFSASKGYLLTTPVCFVTCNHQFSPPPTGKGSVIVSPAALGGDNWSQPAFDPQTNDVVLAGVDTQQKISSSPKGDVYQAGKDQTYLGSQISILPGAYGTITAINVNTGTIDWQVKTPGTSEGGPVVTAGGLAIANSTNNGVVYIINAHTGKVLRTISENGPVGGGDMTYEANGKQFILVPVGGAGTQQGQGRLKGASVSEFIAYSLGG